MGLNSMTGFASAAGRFESGRRALRWTWELRSVNAKGLDIRLRLPSGAERLEGESRKRIQQALSRGSVAASLVLEDRDGASPPVLNMAALEAALAAAAAVRERVGGAPPTVSALLSVKGVLEPAGSEMIEDDLRRLDDAILDGLGEALGTLIEARRGEGGAIAGILEARLSEIESLIGRVAADPSRTPDAIRDNLRQAVARLLETGGELDEARLYQEAALLAVKSDIREEIDRLTAHVEAARQLLGRSGPAGRKLDFLAQEFNRECNTICSKSTAATVTALGLDMKIVIDQFREQVQNVE